MPPLQLPNNLDDPNDPLSSSLTANNPGPIAAAPPGGALAGAGPQIFPPTNSTIPPGRQVGPWTNPSTDANLFGQPANMPNWWPILNAILRGGGNPLILGAGMAMTPTPAQAPGAPRWSWPIAPGSTVDPFDNPRSTAPAAPSPPLPPVRPHVPTVTPPIQTRISPSMVDMGYYRAGVGNARSPVFVPQGQTAAPPIYRGPMTTGGNRTPYYG